MTGRMRTTLALVVSGILFSCIAPWREEIGGLLLGLLGPPIRLGASVLLKGLGVKVAAGIHGPLALAMPFFMARCIKPDSIGFWGVLLFIHVGVALLLADSHRMSAKRWAVFFVVGIFLMLVLNALRVLLVIAWTLEVGQWVGVFANVPEYARDVEVVLGLGLYVLGIVVLTFFFCPKGRLSRMSWDDTTA